MEAQFTIIKATQNKLLRKIIHTLIPLFIFTIHCQILYAQECVIIIQGYEDGNESFASNTADVVETAMSKLPGGAKVTRLAPSKTNKSKMKPTLYKNKAELLKEFETALCKQECQNVILFFIGHGMGGDGINGIPKNNTDGGMWVDNTNKTQNSDFITAAEIAAIIDKCKKYVKLVDNHCYASAMTNGVLDNLENKNLLRIGLSSSKWNEKSYFSKPADASAQYYFFMIEFLKDYYKIIGDPNVMEQIKSKADELKKQAEANNAENATKREEIQKQIDALNAELQKIKDSLKDLEGEKKSIEEKLEKYKGISNDIDDINKLKDEYDQLKKDQVELEKAKTKALKDATAEANKAADEIKKDKKLSSKEKTDKINDLSKELKTKTDDIKNEFKEKNEALDDAIKINKKARSDKSIEINEKLKADKITTSPSDKKVNDTAKGKIKAITDGLGNKIEEIKPKIEEIGKKIEELNKKIEELKKALAEIKDLSTVAPVAELILHEAFKSAEANSKSSTAEEIVSPVGNDPGIKIPDKPVKRVGIGLDEKSKSYAYWIEFYKVIDEKTKECVIVGYEINMQGVPVQPISSISCKEDCSEAKFKVKNSTGGEDIIELNKNDKGKYDGKINNEKKITETLSQNMKSILPGEKIGQLCFIIDAHGYSMLKVHNNEVAPALNQQIDPNISTTMNYANKSLKLIIDFDPHGYHFISTNQINYNQASLYHYSLYDEEGLRLGELGFYHTSNQLEGTLWLEKTNRVYPVNGTWNIYEGFFAASANTEEGSYVFEKNDFDGMVKTYWHAPGYHGNHILQSNTTYLPHIALNRKDMESNDNSLYPTLSWNQNSTQLSDYEKSLLSGTRIMRTENISQTQKIIDLPYNSGSFIDYDVNPFVRYRYIISSSIKYNLDCGFPELSYPLYSYPEYYDWSTDSIQQNQNIDSAAINNLWNKLNLTSNEAKILHSKSKFPWWIPGIIGAGTGLYFILDHKDIVETPPQAIDDEVQLRCGETLTFDPLANDLGEFLSVQSVTGTGSASVSIQNNKLVFSNLFNSQTTLTYTIKDKNGATSSAIISVSVILPYLNIQDISISAQSGDKLNGNIFSASSCLGCQVISVNSTTAGLITWAKDGSYEVNVPIKDEFTTYTFEFFIRDQCAQNDRILLTISAKGTDCNITITSETFSPHCGSNDGSILLTGFDVLTYNYQWNNGMTDYNITNLPAGQYAVTLTHVTKNCHAYYSVTLMEKFQKIITNVVVEAGNCYKSGKLIVNVNRLSSNTFTLLVTGSSGSFQFSSSNENIDIVKLIQNTGYPEPITGQYKVVIFDASLPSICRDSIETEIPIENLLLQANDDKYEIKSGELYTGNVLTNDLGVGLNVVSYSNNENGILTIDEDGSFTFTPKPNITGQIKYLYEVTDTCAQISTASLVFTVSSEECNYQATFMVTPAFCGASNGEVVATIFPNDGNLQFTWSNGTEGLKLINVSAGDYTLTLYNPTLSCSQSFDIFVPEEQLLYVTNAQITQGSCQNPPEILLNLQAPISGILNIVVNGLNSQSTFQSIEGDVFLSEYIDLYPGNWTITINDQGAGPGCAQTYIYELEPFSSLSISLVQIIPPSTPSSNNGVVILEISEGAAPITIFANSLLFPNRFPGLNTLKGFSVGLYNIVAIDNAGCESNTLTIEFQTLLNSEKSHLSYSPATWIPVKIPGSAEKGNAVNNFKNTSASFLNLTIIENDISLNGGLGTVSTYRLINGNQELRHGSFVSFFLGKSISLGESSINLGIRDTYVSSGINQHYNYMSLQFDWMMHLTKNIQFQCGASYLFVNQLLYVHHGLVVKL